MSGEAFALNPEAIRSVTTAFGEAADALSRIQAGEPVGDAGAGVGLLLTAESCRNAQAGITAAFTAAVHGVRSYGDTLDAAVQKYAAGDVSAADDIGNVDIPG